MAPLSALLLIVLSLYSSPRHAAARGGDSAVKLAGLMDGNGQSLFRNLLEESRPEIQEVASRGYMSNLELAESIKEFGKRCANISKIYSIGRSVNGFPLLVMEISDKPGQEEAEPAFKFIGNVHGDEPVGRELLMRLANWLCDNYMQDSLATLIIKNVHLHILPTMNPDGFALKRRGNANNVDLNRDFPDQFFPWNNLVDLREPETKAVMSWVKKQHFAASASLHGGALVANYPWDGSQDSRKHYFACPDDKTFRYMARIYSSWHYNMSLSNEFEGGITNGALWYPIYGGMQDWNYIHGGCFELTLEVSDDKWRKANEVRQCSWNRKGQTGKVECSQDVNDLKSIPTSLPVLWEYNKMSMLNLVASIVKTGVHGRIYSSDGHPLPASVVIKGINYIVNASRKMGDYHRLLAPGECYDVTVSMPGFQSKTTQVWLNDTATCLDFILDPEVNASNPVQVSSNCECNRDCKEKTLVKFLMATYWEISVVVFIVFLFLCGLLKRKALFKFLNYKQGPGHRRLTAV